MTDKMTVAIAAGGTAGHINPALALAEELRDRGHHVVFVGQSRKLEGRLVPEAGFDFVPITVTGFDRSRPWTALTSLWRVNKAKRALASHFSKVGKPDAAIGFGAYVEVPLLGWCKGAGVPYLLHEQNSVPGLANKMMNSHAARVCISVPAARSVFEREGDPDHVLMTGNPVRRSVIEGDRARGRKALGVPEDATLLLVFGGSLGAQHLNERVASLKNELLSRKNLYVLHSTGADGFEETERAFGADARGGEALPRPALHRQHGRYAGCCRFGALAFGRIERGRDRCTRRAFGARAVPACDGRPPNHQCPVSGRRRGRRALRRCRYRRFCLCR